MAFCLKRQTIEWVDMYVVHTRDAKLLCLDCLETARSNGMSVINLQLSTCLGFLIDEFVPPLPRLVAFFSPWSFHLGDSLLSLVSRWSYVCLLFIGKWVTRRPLP